MAIGMAYKSSSGQVEASPECQGNATRGLSPSEDTALL